MASENPVEEFVAVVHKVLTLTWQIPRLVAKMTIGARLDSRALFR
jgi:hypothetical protein